VDHSHKGGRGYLKDESFMFARSPTTVRLMFEKEQSLLAGYVPVSAYGEI
jgi:hypothetical protein